MASFVENFRTAFEKAKTATNPMQKVNYITDAIRENALAAKNNDPSTWDGDKIYQILKQRGAVYDKSESPYTNLDVQIPKTETTVKLNQGTYRLSNNTNLTGINNNNAMYIVGNTYQDNSDGTHYGMGWDGRPYSYSIRGNVVGEFEPLGIDEQKKAIERLTNGKTKIHESITNPATLAAIYRSIKRMQDAGNGNLSPDNVVIGDSAPNKVTLGPGVMGIARENGGTKENPDHIDLLSTNFPGIQSWKLDSSAEEGYNSAGGLDALPQHELAHTAEFATLGAPIRYFNKVEKEAEKYRGKYSAGDLWDDAISKIKYAIPVLSDAIFGTHFVPSEKTVEAMAYSKNKSLSDVADFWYDYYNPLAWKYDTVEEKMRDSAYDKSEEWQQKHRGDSWSIQDNLFKKAADNLGFKSVEDAVSTISEYATNNNTEAFAEAYTDVLINGDDAKPYSKELIRLYMEVADDAAKAFGKNKPTQLKLFQELTNLFPENRLRKEKLTFNDFRNNYRLISR